MLCGPSEYIYHGASTPPARYLLSCRAALTCLLCLVILPSRFSSVFMQGVSIEHLSKDRLCQPSDSHQPAATRAFPPCSWTSQCASAGACSQASIPMALCCLNLQVPQGTLALFSMFQVSFILYLGSMGVAFSAHTTHALHGLRC